MTKALLVFLLAPLAYSQTKIEPTSEDLIEVEGTSLYVENVIVKKVSRKRIADKNLDDREAISIKVEGLQKWDIEKLQGIYQCRKQRPQWLTGTKNPEIWLIDKGVCPKKIIRFCVSDQKQRIVCSAWLRRKNLQPIRGRRYKKVPDEFSIEDGKVFKWKRSDGSLMRINNIAEFQRSIRKHPPQVYNSLLLSTVTSNEGTLFLATGQVQYWPKASDKGQLFFDANRIGVQTRFSSAINKVALIDGRDLTIDWFDLTFTYRRKPHGVFEANHIYTFMTYSNFNSLSRTTARLGGGIGLSFVWPEKIFGWKYPGHIFSYADFSFLPLDLSGDGRGIIVSSKANGVWLFENNWFVTGDVELRLLDFQLKGENSVIRLQFGGGWAF